MPSRTLGIEKGLSLTQSWLLTLAASPGCFVVPYPIEAQEDPAAKTLPFYAAAGKCSPSPGTLSFESQRNYSLLSFTPGMGTCDERVRKMEEAEGSSQEKGRPREIRDMSHQNSGI